MFFRSTLQEQDLKQVLVKAGCHSYLLMIRVLPVTFSVTSQRDQIAWQFHWSASFSTSPQVFPLVHKFFHWYTSFFTSPQVFSNSPQVFSTSPYFMLKRYLFFNTELASLIVCDWSSGVSNFICKVNLCSGECTDDSLDKYNGNSRGVGHGDPTLSVNLIISRGKWKCLEGKSGPDIFKLLRDLAGIPV